MSKRSLVPQHGDRKKPKLDISRSDHHLPLSQNNSTNNKENNCDVWGDDDDEQMLLQASQACEEEQINDISMLPDYSSWKQPGSTSTQYMPSPSTSKASFEFKKPSSIHPNSISTNLKNKCNTISSPLPGISTMRHEKNSNLIYDLGNTEKIVSGEESDIRRRTLQIEEELNKLKSEYGKLYDKFVAKEGEASILRSQLRASQVANDNARMETIRIREKVQMECNEKLVAITKEKQGLKNELEFKDLEILNVKDKLKKYEVNKLRLTQLNDISRHNTQTAPYDAMTQQKRVKMTSNSVQTEDKAPFLKLNKSCGKDVCMAGPCNTLAGLSFARNRSFKATRNFMSNRPETDNDAQLFSNVMCELNKLEAELKALDASPGFCDDRPPTTPLLSVNVHHLFNSQRKETHRAVWFSSNVLLPRPLYPAERGVDARTLLTELASALDIRSAQGSELGTANKKLVPPTILDTALRICDSIGNTSRGMLYSGFLMSLILTFSSLQRATEVLEPKILSSVKAILLSKPMPFVSLELLAFVSGLSSVNSFLPLFCPGSAKDAMQVNQDEKNSEQCYLIELLKQTEHCLDCMKNQRLEISGHVALFTLRHLVGIFEYVNDKYRQDFNRSCPCQQLAARVLTLALRAAVGLLLRAGSEVDHTAKHKANWCTQLLAACRSCVRQLHKCVSSGAACLQPHEGPLSDALYRLHSLHPALCDLAELMNAFQTAPEEAPTSYLQQPLMASFTTFSMTD